MQAIHRNPVRIQGRWLLCVVPFICSCSGRLPQVKPPSINVVAAADGALAQWDTDGDGGISKDEACMGIRDQWQRYDRDGNDSISPEELKQRFREWTDGDTGLMNLRVQLTYRRQPLTGANITMTPFAFLGPRVLESSGVTDAYGYAFMAIPKDQLPKSQQTNFGMQVGLYQVTIEHSELGDKYSAESTLSVDLSPNEANTGVVFHLK